MEKRTGLVLTGGGARAAYQVGVLRAIATIIRAEKIPFQVISGYSAGALNGVWLADRRESFLQATQTLWEEWASLTPEQVFNTDAPNMLMIALRWIKDRSLGGLQSDQQISYLLDTKPLGKLIRKKISFEGVRARLASGELHALSVTAVNYHTGQSVSFFEGHSDLEGWNKLNRVGFRAELTHQHILASASIPVFFPPVKIGHSFYGDGMVRLNSPLSAAVRLGSERLLLIGVRGPSSTSQSDEVAHKSVSISEIAGTILNGLFFDSLDADLERMQRINRTLSIMKPEELEKQSDHLRLLPVLSLRPSEEVGDLPACELSRMPSTLRFLLRGIGLVEGKGTDLLSYLSFEPRYIKSLLELGYEDTMAKRDQVLDFFSMKH